MTLGMPLGSSEPRTTHSSSPRTSSSSATHQASAPNYLSPRSADVILSEVRPTRIKSEALRSVNVFLDELLWLILGYARSFSTERLRMGLLKILPTTLGKDALLEAEVELRAFMERNPPAVQIPTDDTTTQKFPLQPAFELLRTKCEAYSSLGDEVENLELETALHSRMVQIAGDAAPNLSDIAPAALYLTAILEHICEHVLSNVGRVVARDSSRTTAHAQDLYVALCEDETVYSLFKTMKVQEHIEQQAKSPAPRQRKSLSQKEPTTPVTESASDATAVHKSRRSLDSAISNGSSNNHANRSSVDKARNRSLFKNASNRSVATEMGSFSSADALPLHRRSNSLVGNEKRHFGSSSDEGSKSEGTRDTLAADAESTQDFDNLMRSGTTMKVSLTPDRLKTFEVFAKERNQRANRSGNVAPSHPPSSYPNGLPSTQQTVQQQPGRKRVESIPESPEDMNRSRTSIKDEPPATPRSRSNTETRPADKSFADAIEPPSTPRRNNMPAPTSTGIPKNVHHGSNRRPESMDLDDIMNMSDEDSVGVKKSSMKPKSAQTTESGTRDLMDFLSTGPPEPLADLPAAPNPSAFDAQKKGRFGRIVSRLTGSASNERLAGRSGEDGMDAVRRPPMMGISPIQLSAPPPPLNAKRSVPNVSVGPRYTPSSSSPASPAQGQDGSSPRTRKPSLTRKPVPSARIPKEKEDVPVPPKPLPVVGETRKPLPTSPSSSTPNSGSAGSSPARKRVPREVEQAKLVPTPDVSTEVKTAPAPSANGHAESTKGTLSVPSRTERRSGAEKESSEAISRSDRNMGVSMPAEELIVSLQDLMAKATTADECRVLMHMFLAMCGAPGDRRKEMGGAIAPPAVSIPPDIEKRDESNLVTVLLSDEHSSSIAGSAGTWPTEQRSEEESTTMVPSDNGHVQATEATESTESTSEMTVFAPPVAMAGVGSS